MRPLALLLIVLALLAGAAWGLRDQIPLLDGLAARFPRASGAPPRAPARGAGVGAALPADGYVVTPVPVLGVARTTGTLVANEAVEISSEVSRRLVTVLVRDGERVERGKPLFLLDDSDLRASLQVLEVRQRLAEATAARLARLHESGVANAQELDVALAERELIAAEQRALEVAIERTVIRAPFAGRLGIRRVSEGAWVTPATPLTSLADLSRVKIDFALPERYAPAIRRGLRFTFRVARRAAVYGAIIAAVEPEIDPATRSLRCRGLAENPGDALEPGAFVAIEVPIAEPAPGAVIPSHAVIPIIGGHAVYVARDGAAVELEVTLGERGRATVHVLEGLSAGDVVLTSNLLRLRPGAAVALAEVTRGAPPGFVVPRLDALDGTADLERLEGAPPGGAADRPALGAPAEAAPPASAPPASAPPALAPRPASGAPRAPAGAPRPPAAPPAASGGAAR